MNASSKCTRWRTQHWNCAILDALTDPDYFSPPIPPTGGPILRAEAYHASICPNGQAGAGWVFEREALGSPWTRTA